MDASAKVMSIENTDVINSIESNDFIVFGYPIYYSNVPKIVNDFIDNNKKVFNNKDIYIIATMGLFSGDRAGCSARLVSKLGVNVVGGLHLKMPDCIGDVKLLKKSREKNKIIIKEATKKIENSVERFKAGKPIKDGLNMLDYIGGLFGQRLWFSTKTNYYTNNVKINEEKCTTCGKCIEICPMNNLKLSNGKCTI